MSFIFSIFDSWSARLDLSYEVSFSSRRLSFWLGKHARSADLKGKYTWTSVLYAESKLLSSSKISFFCIQLRLLSKKSATFVGLLITIEDSWDSGCKFDLSKRSTFRLVGISFDKYIQAWSIYAAKHEHDMHQYILCNHIY